LSVSAICLPGISGALDHLADFLHRLIAMYVFELFYRPKISPVSVGHHIGTIMIGQSAIAISLNLVREKDATIEFILCTVWGKLLSQPLPFAYQLLTQYIYRRIRHCLRIPSPHLDHLVPSISHFA